MPTFKLVCIAEIEAATLEGAQNALDAFREAVQPSLEYGVFLYRATEHDLGGAPAQIPQKEKRIMPITFKIQPATSPAGKLADVEVVFGADAGPFAGLKLVGFAIWERRAGGRNVTFPARTYSVNGVRRSFALLRPTHDQSEQDAIRDAILEAYETHETLVHNEATTRDLLGL